MAPSQIVASAARDDSSFDQRWAAWIAKGIEHDRKSTNRMLAAALIAASAVVAAVILML